MNKVQESFLSLALGFFLALINAMLFCISLVLAVVFKDWLFGLIAGLSLSTFLIIFCYSLVYQSYKELGNKEKEDGYRK